MVKALRPKQWLGKNALLFAALIFSYQFVSVTAWVQAIAGFVAFCLVSSTGYVINDIFDAEADRQHPTKCQRPIASGALPVRTALAQAAFICALGMVTAASLGWPFLAVTLAYFATTMSYSFFFKRMVILDVMMITAGFLWRAVAGAVAIHVTISPWLLLCAAFLALFLGFNKRRGEVLLLAEKAAAHRENLAEYGPEMIRAFQSITTSSTVISYAIYTVLGAPESSRPWLLVTLPYVLYGIFRYIYLVERGVNLAPDEILVRDRPIQVTVILYGITAVAVLLLSHGAAT